MGTLRFGAIVLSLVLLGSFAVETPAWAKRPHKRSLLIMRNPTGSLRNMGAALTLPIVARTDQPPATQSLLPLPPSFIVFHSDRVKRDLVLFHVAAAGIDPTLPGDRSPAPYGFVAAPMSEDPLAEMRLRDRLLLFEPTSYSNGAAGAGAALFGAATIAAAHAPAPLRVVFDGPLRLGPAIFSDGGMGVGVGGSAL